MKHYLITLFFSLLGINLQAQIESSRDVIGSSGSEFSNTTLQMSFTVGESFTLSLQNDGIHTQGFQQSDRWFTTVSQLHESQFQLFPNPASNEITIQSDSNKSFKYEIQDPVGRVISSGDSVYSGFTLYIGDLPGGNYLFHMINERGDRSTLGFITIQ